MATANLPPGTGIAGLDRILKGLLPGDNIVLQVDSINDYTPFVAPFCGQALLEGRKVIYFRFAHHEQLLQDISGLEIVRLDPQAGFESFAAEIHRKIGEAGPRSCYVFDCLSDLAADWYSDLMLGNFFMVTCPYLYELETITYFALLRHRHWSETVASIRDTTQLLIDVHRHRGKLYVHPLKVWKRDSPTMYFPHVREGDEFRTVTESAVIADLFASTSHPEVGSAARVIDMWNRVFFQAQDALARQARGEALFLETDEIFERLLRMMVTRDARLLKLAKRYLKLADLLAIRKRMLGTGLIGGKSAGMILARAILCDRDDKWKSLLETHDSFYIGCDVFYTYLVRNNCWRLRQRQRDPARYLQTAAEARERILTGTFPGFIRSQFVEMLEYFGQAPIVVRSSSLLEDAFGNAFAGKYVSVFCVNQGTPEERLEAFENAVRRVFASAMGEEALDYRARRGLLAQDEQMALLVQRVSGAMYGDFFFPQAAGVGLSFNPYAWSEKIDPEAGLLRLVFGLGTRAVLAFEGDYTRIVALNAPLHRPEASLHEQRECSQKRVDVLNLKTNRLDSRWFEEVAGDNARFPLEIFASRDEKLMRRAREAGQKDVFPWLLTFEKLLTGTSFTDEMRDLLRTLSEAYEHPVDVEFTVNFLGESACRIHLVQCRPFKVKGGGCAAEPPETIDDAGLVLQTRGPVIGPVCRCFIDRLIYVVPSVYARMPERDRHSVAKLVGRLAHLDEGACSLMLIGPGRWGTTTPSLGVPVSFADISPAAVLCEIAEMHADLVPEVSLGTHFFNEIVENDTLYLAVFPDNEGVAFNRKLLEGAPNSLIKILPDCGRWQEAVRVIEPDAIGEGLKICLNANAQKQRAVCYLTAGE
ncbi:MAG: pyruvate, phosphate dikinase [Acidobacteria bacterium]|nr:pyruvate, phosphate dikinase [Acidobacteriota bacterium]